MLRVFTAFSGYDSQCLALNRLGIDYDLVGWSEIDRYAIQAHNALFPQWSDRNFGDISKIDWNQVPDFDFLTYSSPCQDFSIAGKRAGGEEGSGTRSSLLWEVRRAILAKKPKYMLMENVAALVSKKFIGQFNKWQLELSQYGYTNFSQVLNAKNYGVPQNRDRIFMVSILNCTYWFYFPTPIPLEKRLKDVLEENVDDGYYLNERLINTFNKHAERHGGLGKNFGWKPTDGNVIANALLAGSQNRPSGNYIKEVGMINKGLSGKVYDEDGLCPTITASEGVKYNTKIIQRGHGFNNGGVFEDYTPTVTKSSYMYNNLVIEPKFRIRKLTERECFRLMGVSEEDIDKLIYHSGFIVWNGKKYVQVPRISKSRLYKLAGNSIVVDVLVAIFNQLFSENKTTDKQLKLF